VRKREGKDKMQREWGTFQEDEGLGEFILSVIK
jgi:hypothetical protein